MAYLTILSGPRRGDVAALKKKPLRLGRDLDVEIPLDDPKASRVHVRVEPGDESDIFVVHDLHSKNGTFINGRIIREPQILREGDKITIGDTKIAFTLVPPTGDVHKLESSVTDAQSSSNLNDGTVTAAKDQESYETIELHEPLKILREPKNLSPRDRSKETVGSNETDLNPVRVNEALRALYAVARAVAEAGSAHELLAILQSRLRSALSADRVIALPVDDNDKWTLPQTSTTRTTDSAAAQTFSQLPVSRTIVDYSLNSKKSVLTAPQADERFAGAQSIGEQGISTALCVPILHGGKVFALLYADRLGGESFDRHDQELITAACLQAGPSLAALQKMENLSRSRERLLVELKSQFHILGNSKQMKQIGSFIERATAVDSGVLILGESGTGKELVARAIHYNSRRRDNPFVTVNCAALSESLIESELFGHTKGAFTGAASERVGRFEAADTGTIFLDEIGELSAACQTKLLRVLEEGQISRVGESKIRKINVRVLAATNRDLAVEVDQGGFRKDLYYRLNILAVSLPPLRERGDDIDTLLDFYLDKAGRETSRNNLQFSQEAKTLLKAYRWPGNVRELRNVTERAAVLCPSDVIGIQDLPPEYQSKDLIDKVEKESTQDDDAPQINNQTPDSGSPDEAPASLAEAEKLHILKILESCGGNKKAASQKLGIDRSTLYAKLRAYGL